jgi:formate hydrogenlyase subunit 6/NADH:ubiquinone oxidoreductase subunit I
MSEIAGFLRLIWERVLEGFRYRPVTIEYPFVAKPLPQMARTRLRNNFPDCTGCLDCEAQCPTQAIKIGASPFPYTVGLPKTSKGIEFERNVESFEIDYSQCVLCGICVSACSTESLTFDRRLFPPKIHAANLKVDLVHIPRSMRRGN